MTTDEKLENLEKRVAWNRKHLRIVFIIALIALLMISGHFVLHALGKLPH